MKTGIFAGFLKAFPRKTTGVMVLGIILALGPAVPAEDWPMWGRDPARSGRFPMELLPETFHLQWVRELPGPRRAWPGQGDDEDKLEFDLSYSPAAMGGMIFVPSMNTDSLTAYEIETGRELWRYYADGPVRLAPAAWQGMVYFVSDDGHLYCLDALSGDLRWKFDARAAGHRVLGNERVISMWPARGGPVIKDGTIYFAAGVWPFLGTFVFALSAEDGGIVWANTEHSTRWQRQPHSWAYAFAGISPQGYLAVSGNSLVVSGGRSQPAIFDRRDGSLIHSSVDGRRRGGYRVQIKGDRYYNHGWSYRLSDGEYLGRGDGENRELFSIAEQLSDRLDSGVFEVLAAGDRLLVVTRKGSLYCFGPEPSEATVYSHRPLKPELRQDGGGRRAEEILRQSGKREGYALFLGAGCGDLLEQLTLRSEMHIVAIEPDELKIAELRRRFDDAGLYGGRIALLPGMPLEAEYPDYTSSLVVMEDPAVLGCAPDENLLEAVYGWLRPYDGKAFLRTDRQTKPHFREAVDKFNPEAGRAVFSDGTVTVVREGALPGSGQWTHQYADSAQSVMSGDYRVRPPFGPVWFGGPSNENILPRHAAGPRPQIAGGRLVILGVETISARCVFTGREIWTREFPGIGHPFTDIEREKSWEAGRQIALREFTGASNIGSPYVTLSDGVYIRYRGRIFRLDPATGETLSEWSIPGVSPEAEEVDWGHISVSEDTVITTAKPHIFRGGTFGRSGDDAWDGTSSERLLALDRHSGEVLWVREAGTAFRHTAIAASGGRLFVSDLLSERALELALRRGMRVEERPRLIALDLRTGEELWSVENDIFGTFLSYSREHDILVEGGTRDARRTLPDEPTRLMTARAGSDGEIIWSRRGAYSGPVILRGDMIIPARPGRAISLLTGERERRGSPVTGEEIQWRYWKAYGCGTANASPHVLTFRSGAAGFFDLEQGGTGTLGGFRAGCTANIIAADGILNAPDYTRTCRCSYQNQTSLGLVHMPEMELWTTDPIIRGVNKPILRLGVNLGAPGDRRSENGTLWTPFPRTTNEEPGLAVLINAKPSTELPLRVLAVRTSHHGFHTTNPEHTVDGDFSTRWHVRSDRRRRFRQWVEYELSKPVSLDRIEAAWEGPESTQFYIETSMDGTEWNSVFAEESRGPGKTMKVYTFDSVPAKYVRIRLNEHGDEENPSSWAYIYQARIGELPYPDAYSCMLAEKDTFRKHSLLVDGAAGLNWVASSGIRDLRRFELLGVGGEGLPHTVTLHFSEPDGLETGQRVFDVYVQDKLLAEGFDISARAGGADRAVTLTAPGISASDSLAVELDPASGSNHPPVLCGIELIRE